MTVKKPRNLSEGLSNSNTNLLLKKSLLTLKLKVSNSENNFTKLL